MKFPDLDELKVFEADVETHFISFKFLLHCLIIITNIAVAEVTEYHQFLIVINLRTKCVFLLYITMQVLSLQQGVSFKWNVTNNPSNQR